METSAGLASKQFHEGNKGEFLSINKHNVWSEVTATQKIAPNASQIGFGSNRIGLYNT